MLIPRSVTLAASNNVATSTGNRILAANSAVNRYIRGITVTNTTAAPIAFSCGIGAAATLSAANADVAFGVSIPANAASFPVATYSGRGRVALGASSVNEI